MSSNIDFNIAAVVRNIVDTVPGSALRATFPLEFADDDDDDFDLGDPDASRISGVSALLEPNRQTGGLSHVPLDPAYLWDLDPALDSALAGPDGGESFWPLAQNAHRYRDSVGGSASRSRARKPSSRRESMPGEIVSMSVKKLVAYIDYFITDRDSPIDLPPAADSDVEQNPDEDSDDHPQRPSPRGEGRTPADTLHRLLAASCLVKMLRLRGSAAYMPFSPASFAKVVRVADADLGTRFGNSAQGSNPGGAKKQKAPKAAAKKATGRKRQPEAQPASESEDDGAAMEIDHHPTATSSRSPPASATPASLLTNLLEQIYLLLSDQAAHARVQKDWESLKGLTRAAGEAIANGGGEAVAPLHGTGTGRGKKKVEDGPDPLTCAALTLLSTLLFCCPPDFPRPEPSFLPPSPSTTLPPSSLPTLRLILPLVHRSLGPALLFSTVPRGAAGSPSTKAALERSGWAWKWVIGVVQRCAALRDSLDGGEEGKTARWEVEEASMVVVQQIALQAADRPSPVRAQVLPELVALAQAMGETRYKKVATWVGRMGVTAKVSSLFS
ncbi:hypothetical protein M427DRAFT_210546 [Gonapodya prolifera JEL478]|uniref:Uncharacterized protein n=1 Tax=Gonapodya prolifera (strain JEL478) TaxID=1344416 RepID=A0A139APM8_GONPJ|nr:hypothetical protein M427DRAFT_210546 [Gonapodya prolifera JEL478]|eukprot:KXS18445.1 hypothetical protein M427DRAFT_210546 [Gonapodya prolifera JEL478]